MLRLRGKGGPGEPPGNALIEVGVGSHPLFRCEGRDVHLDLPVSLPEAVLGGPVTIPTVNGLVAMTVPPRSDAGTRLRLRGKGVPAHGTLPAGNAYVTLRVVLDPTDEGLAAFLRDRTDAPTWDPRKAMEASS